MCKYTYDIQTSYISQRTLNIKSCKVWPLRINLFKIKLTISEDPITANRIKPTLNKIIYWRFIHRCTQRGEEGKGVNPWPPILNLHKNAIKSEKQAPTTSKGPYAPPPPNTNIMNFQPVCKERFQQKYPFRLLGKWSQVRAPLYFAQVQIWNKRICNEK